MKKINYIKKALHKVIFITPIILIASCSNSQEPENTKFVVAEYSDAKFDINKNEKDAQFLVNAAQINIEKIQLGQLAQQNGNAPHVKELGKMMVAAHTESQIDLIAIAESKMITIPYSPTDYAKNAYTRLNKKSGNDFDKAYTDMMVNGHEDAIKTYEKAARNGNDTEIKNWATSSLPGLRKHLAHSIQCKEKCDKM